MVEQLGDDWHTAGLTKKPSKATRGTGNILKESKAKYMISLITKRKKERTRQSGYRSRENGH